MTLTPEGQGLRANMALMDGQYEMAGSATKQAPGAPVRAGGFGGGGRGSATNDQTDFSPKPPYRARTPAEQAAGFMLPAGYRLELVAADPELISPTMVEFDGNGRMYVGEMISYMMDAEASREHDPISRISRWESTKGDGRYDKRTIFADNLVAPRLILPLTDGVILTSETDSDDLIKLTDTNGDGVADKREVVFTGIGQSREHRAPEIRPALEHGQLDLHDLQRVPDPLDAVGLPARADGTERRPVGSGVRRRRQAVVRGCGRRTRADELPVSDSLRCVHAVPGGRTWWPRRRGATPPAANPNCPPGMENGFEKDFAVVWPAPGIGDMQGGIPRTRMPAQNLNHFTAAAGPAIFRGDRLPADLKGHLLFTEPVGRLVRRAAVDNIEGPDRSCATSTRTPSSSPAPISCSGR